MGLAAGPVSGMAFMQMGFILDMDALGAKAASSFVVMISCMPMIHTRAR